MKESALTLDQELSLVRKSRVDARAFGALYDHYFPRIYNYVYFRIRDRGMTDDLVSTIFVRAIGRLDTYRESRGSFGVWLFRIAHNVVVDHYRGAGRAVTVSLDHVGPILDAAPSVEGHLAREQERETLMGAVSQLPDREQEIIGLKFGGGLTNRKIAALMGLGENHVAVILYRAMRKLRLVLDEPPARCALSQDDAAGFGEGNEL